MVYTARGACFFRRGVRTIDDLPPPSSTGMMWCPRFD
jgi:hypothetical protein